MPRTHEQELERLLNNYERREARRQFLRAYAWLLVGAAFLFLGFALGLLFAYTH
jgi:hypothetical protein